MEQHWKLKDLGNIK